ncbi:MAG: response regulator [Deltaproteobacteria bacterium]|nr:response regulator [Deltaproteobacteria bacterium]
MDDERDDRPPEERVVVEPTTLRDREVTQQLEQAVNRVRRAKDVLDRAHETGGRESAVDAEYDTGRLASSRSIAGSRVLLVDDEDVIRRLMTRMIEGHGCECISAPSGEEAMPLIEKQVFDLLIVDKNLPGMSGIDIAKQARRHQPGVPVLLITAYASEESALEAAAYGVTDYVMKPIDLEDFRRRMIGAITTDPRRRRDSFADLGRSPSQPARPRRVSRPSRPSGRRLSLTSSPPAPTVAGPLNVVVLLYDSNDESRVQVEAVLKPVCTKLSVFAERGLAESFARSAGFDVLVAAPAFLSDAFAWWEDVPGKVPLGSIAIMDRRGIDKAIEAIQLGARGSLHPPFEETKTQFEFRRAVTALLEERRRK